jgi:beta-lactamase superfamily II metal-dependent hydrolase
MIRTFLPVGQGGFVTERFTGFNMVYDCGSLNSTSILENQVKNAFYPGEEVDILFISHFDADHINGIDILKSTYKIKSVVIPLLTKKEIDLQIFINEAVYGFSNNRIVSNTEAYFGSETRIIRVSKAEEGDSIQEGSSDLENINNKIKSGTKISINKWYFIPFNFKFSERSPELLRLLKIRKINPANKNSILNNIDEIKNAYYGVQGKLNSNSMVLLSGSLENNKYVYQTCPMCDLNYPRIERYHNHDRGLNSDGCLYFGDFNLRITKGFKDFELVFKKTFKSIGTIQIPHHGSKHNFDKRILFFNSPDYHLFSCIIQAGTNNQFGHPSSIVIQDIISQQSYLSVVTEEMATLVTQIIDGF